MAFLSSTRRPCGPVPARRPSFLDLMALWRQRRALSTLDARTLKDIGLTRDEAEAEARRPFWDIPANLR